MLKNLSEEIRECLHHAEDCARRAAAHPEGSTLRQDFLDLERRWLGLARSIQLVERLTDFSNETARKASAPIIPFLRDQAFDPETVEAMGKAFVTTCEALGFTDRTDAMTKLVAEKIIELARRGLKNPTALLLATMQDFKTDPQ